MHLNCECQDLEEELLSFICANPRCGVNRFSCQRCRVVSHKNCLEHVLEIQHILNRNAAENSNLIANPEIKQAFNFLVQNNITRGKEQLFQVYESLINKEFDQIIETFVKKVHETKQKMLENARVMYNVGNINIEEFKTKLETHINMDALAELINALDQGHLDFSVVNQELTNFFENAATKSEQDKSIIEVAKNINSFAKYYIDLDQRPFEDLRQRLNFEKFDASPFKIWSWHPELKSSYITIGAYNTLAQKTQFSDHYNTAVIGTIAFSKGVHKWEIELATRDAEHNWISFGVIETKLIKEVTDFPYCEAVGIDTYGRLHNMVNEGLMANYDNKTFLCELDMDNGTFTISYGGTVVAKQKKSLKGKIIVPFADMGEPWNVVRLHVLNPL